MIRLVIPDLSYPPGKNNTHQFATRARKRDGQPYQGLMLTPAATAWLAETSLRTRAAASRAGVRAADSDRWWLAVVIHLRSYRMDSDAPIALAVDAVEKGLGINDSFVGASLGVKTRVNSPDDRGADLYVALEPLDSDAAWNERSLEALAHVAEVWGWSRSSEV